MNRLWVRFSLAFVAVIVLTICTFLTVTLLAILDRDRQFLP